MSKELEFLIDTVKNASKLITDEFEVRAKDDKGDLVTNFDFEVEQYIIDRIHKEYPTFSIVSEEFNTNNELSENCFVIDPIDGTINFANHLPLWAIQVACVKGGKTIASVVYAPRLDEIYYADEDGAYLNGEKISVNNKDVHNGLYCIEGLGEVVVSREMIRLNRNYRKFYCLSLDYAFVACGRLSATNFRRNNIWDYLPGQFLVEKAGGVIYNAPNMHIGANSQEFVEVMIENTSADE